MDLAEKYYLLALAIEEYKHPAAMFNLGNLYCRQQNKFDLAEKYYLLAIEQDNHASAMVNLGNLYMEQNKFDLAEKYYLLAIKDNHANAMVNLKILKKIKI